MYKAIVIGLLVIILITLSDINKKMVPAPDPRFVALAESYSRLQQETEYKIKDVTNKINACIDHPNFRDCVRNYGIKINECKARADDS